MSIDDRIDPHMWPAVARSEAAIKAEALREAAVEWRDHADHVGRISTIRAAFWRDGAARLSARADRLAADPSLIADTPAPVTGMSNAGGCVPCRVCGGSQDRGWHTHDNAAPVAVEGVETAEGPRILTVPSEDAMYEFLTALNVSGIHPELPCTQGGGGVAFLATLTDPDADHVHIVVTDEGGTVHCCECAHPGERPNQWDPNVWKPTYPVVTLVSEWPDMERVSAEDYIDVWWSPVEPETSEPEGGGSDA